MKENYTVAEVGQMIRRKGKAVGEPFVRTQIARKRLDVACVPHWYGEQLVSRLALLEFAIIHGFRISQKFQVGR